jgi:mRNA degradation ribonuclease J1/J2
VSDQMAVPKGMIGELTATRDEWRTRAATYAADIERVVDLIQDAEESGRTTVLIENLRRALRLR